MDAWIGDKNNDTVDALFLFLTGYSLVPSKQNFPSQFCNKPKPIHLLLQNYKNSFNLLSFETFFNIFHCHCHYYSTIYIHIVIQGVTSSLYHISFSTWAVYMLINSIN